MQKKRSSTASASSKRKKQSKQDEDEVEESQKEKVEIPPPNRLPKRNFKILSLFNHKGGVGKTTDTHIIFYNLVRSGKTVLAIDFDLQSSLSWSILNTQMLETENWEQFLENCNIQTIGSVLTTYNAQTDVSRLHPVLCVQAGEAKGFLSASNQVLLEVEEQLTRDVAVFAISPAVYQNIVKFYDVILQMAEKLKVDYVLLDLNPSFSTMNKLLLTLTDYLITPCSVDCFSENALLTLERKLPNYIRMTTDMRELPSIISSINLQYRQANPIPFNHCRYLGHIINNYHLREGQNPFRVEADRISSLKNVSQRIKNALGEEGDVELAKFSDYTSVKNNAQVLSIPVPFMTQALERYSKRIQPHIRVANTLKERFTNWKAEADSLIQKIIQASSGHEIFHHNPLTIINLRANAEVITTKIEKINELLM
jgi:cellulose biosynthesis protein BcsQ